MSINWFPGHMTKSLRTMEAEIKNIDCVIYVLDSRAPFACLNPEFDKIIKTKAVLVVLNKLDLADETKVSSCLTKLKESFGENSDFVTLNSTASGGNAKIFDKIEKLCEKKIQKNANKGVIANIKVMVIGVPNCGKSTLINNLCGKAKTITGDKAGVTRGKQWVTVRKNIQILDTPGTLYPNISNEKVARYLAYIGSIKNEILDFNDLCFMFVKDIIKQYPHALQQRYGVEYSKDINQENDDIVSIIENIAKSRHYTIKGGEIDYDRTSVMIIDDFRKNRLGKITLL